MSFFNSIWADLVEKRLWPIAVALVIALIAIPLVITGKKSDAADQILAGLPMTTATPAPGKLGPTALSAPQVKLLQGTKRHATSSPRDPFSQPKAPVVIVKPLDTAPVPAGGGSPTPTTTAAPTPYVPPTTSTKPKTPKKADDPSLYKVSLRVGQSGNLKTHASVERLSPLPSVTDPFFVFMGVLDDGKTAVFLLSSDAKATGDGHCKPTPQNCQTVEMKAQDIEFFDVTSADPTAPPTQYELDLTKIIKSSTSTGAISTRAVTAQARSGARVVNAARAHGAAAQLADYAFSPSTGVLERRLPTLSDVLANIASTPAG